jgi:hypothetical protein
MLSLTIVFHTLHIICAAFWFGSLLYTEIILWPRLRAAGQLESVQKELRSIKARKLMGVFIVGTIVFGFLRGVTGGAIDRLYSPYGIMFVVAGLGGTSMLIWWISFPTRDRKIAWRMFYSGFWLMLALMIGMRFSQ